MQTYYSHLTETERAQIVKIKKQSESKKYDCFNPRCSEKTEGSRNHLLQKNGILSNIQGEKGEIWFCNVDTFYDDFRFLKKHINQAYKFNGLCPKCDDSVFAKIEKTEPDFSSPHTHYLFSLRAFLCEKRKHDNHLNEIDKLKKTNFWDKISESQLRMEETILYKKKIAQMYEDCYFKSTENQFKSKFRIISKLDIACSTSISLTAHTNSGEPRIRSFFIHVLPFHNKTCVSISIDKELVNVLNYNRLETYVPEKLFLEINKIDEKKLKKYISDIMLRYAEDWIVSDNFYQNLILPRKEKIVEELRKGLSLNAKFSENWDDPKFNLFDSRT